MAGAYFKPPRDAKYTGKNNNPDLGKRRDRPCPYRIAGRGSGQGAGSGRTAGPGSEPLAASAPDGLLLTLSIYSQINPNVFSEDKQVLKSPAMVISTRGANSFLNQKPSGVR